MLPVLQEDFWAGARTLKLSEQAWIYPDRIWSPQDLNRNSLPQDTELEHPNMATGQMSENASAFKISDRYVPKRVKCFIYRSITVLGGLRGSTGNTSLIAAFGLAQEMDKDRLLWFRKPITRKGSIRAAAYMKQNGIEILFGNPDRDELGKNIILPAHPSDIKVRDYDNDKARTSYIKLINNYM